MFKILASIAFAALALSGCGHFANLGIDKDRLDTANKQLAAYVGEVTALAMLGNELVDRDVITPAQGGQAADHLQSALDLAKAAQAQLEETGDPLSAESKIEQIARSVDLALGVLTRFAPGDQSLLQLKERLAHAPHRRFAPA